MAFNIVGNSVNDLFFKVSRELVSRPITKSRNGDVRRVTNIELELSDPTNRNLGLTGRNNNIVACIAETLWVLAGENRISPYLDFFIPRAIDYSDDGKSWYGAYGPRIYLGRQLDKILQNIEEEGVETRRNVIGIWNQTADTADAGRKDRPCNTALWFWVEDNKLSMKVQSRSGDVLWGLLNINIFEWTVFQEVVLTLINNHNKLNLELGSYYHGCIDAHLYEERSKQARDVIDNYVHREEKSNSRIMIGDIDNQSKLRNFFSKIILLLSEEINFKYDRSECVKEDYLITNALLRLNLLFNVSNVPIKDNLLYEYCALVVLYIYQKLYKIDFLMSFKNMVKLNDNLRDALGYCKFIHWRD